VNFSHITKFEILGCDKTTLLKGISPQDSQSMKEIKELGWRQYLLMRDVPVSIPGASWAPWIATWLICPLAKFCWVVARVELVLRLGAEFAISVSLGCGLTLGHTLAKWPFPPHHSMGGNLLHYMLICATLQNSTL
jgi:hypothetical protein